MAANQIVFRKHMTVGNPAAEEDAEFLQHCFINNGDIDVIKDVGSSKCIILGRTGAGKSALIKHIIDSEDHMIQLSPDAL